jgi:eukaryotic-like serine/threonine-protein kinase
MIGRILDDRYEIEKLLGEGGMGSIYSAVHTFTHRRVAVKVIAPHLAQNAEMVVRFQREARTAGLVDTEHIVQVLDAGRDRELGASFMVMELLKGEDLHATIRRLGALPPELALRIAAQTCIGLQKAHDAGIVHRDIKPGNIFLARRDDGTITVKLLDFGIAKIKVDELRLTRTGHVLGSPAYASPEQAQGSKTIDHRTDVWSLGAVLYEMLCTRTPHAGLRTLGQVVLAICATPVRSVQDFAPWVSPHIAAVVHGCLTIDVHRRISSARDVLESIRPLLRHGWSLSDGMFAHLAAESGHSTAPRGIATSETTIVSAPKTLSSQQPDARLGQYRRGR